MSSTAEACKDALSCPICMETLTNPKILTCGHSLCLTPCLAEIVKQPDPVCPLCRKAIVLPPSGKIEDIATNFSVTSLLEILEKTDYADKTSTDIPCHTQEDGDYVCMTCLEQICSCCQLSFHIDNTHNCTPVSEFTENVQQDVSKNLAVVNESRWSEQTERYAAAFTVMPTYLNLLDKITTACNEILLSLSEKKLDLRKIKKLQKQVKQKHPKFIAARERVKAKMQEVLKKQLAEYRQKLIKLKCSDIVYRQPALSLKILSFDNLKEKTEATIESLTEQIQAESFHVLAMEDKLHDIGENIEVIEKFIKDITKDYHTCLLREIGVTDVVEPQHLFRVTETVEVMNLGSTRFSGDITLKCNELNKKFQASKDFVKTSCSNLLKKFHNRPFQLTEAKGKVVKIVEEVEKCKMYYESIYEIIGKHFVIYDNGSIKRYVQHDLMAKNNSLVLESTPEGKTQFVKRHLAMYESYRHTTKNECKVLIMYLSEMGPILDTKVVHEKLKAIEMRLEETEYHCTLLTSLVAKEGRCHEIAEELKKVFLPEQTINAKIQKCHEHNNEVQRLWKLVEEHEPMTISSDVRFITSISKTMQRRRNNVFSIFMLSKSDLEVLGRRMSNLVQVMNLRARLRKEFHEISNQMPDTYHRHQEELSKLHLLSEITNSDPIVCLRSFTSQELVLLLDQAKTLDKLNVSAVIRLHH
ncbi:E3 ubiquitin-protein ligase TRIM56 [Holothuria leucospilota]|uniref:E3 ubiquitin-protein ligase TRIM56 n=1 Tax=Holothuria leucospilota TaxID=206669 RepID=A0A9Q1BL15_HOLLE|nr:E3 ubiquitin-protein ligase TRIM56 [Holothuria leucospilota]